MSADEQKVESVNKSETTAAANASSGKQPTNGGGDAGNNRKSGGGGDRAPEQPIMVARNKSGVVKWFSFKNGYGFITVDEDGDDIFVHRSEFIREGAREVFYHIDVGDKLEFDIINRAKGREAVAVTGPGGIRVPGSPAFGRRRYTRSENRGGNGPRDGGDNQQQYDDERQDGQGQKAVNGDAKKRGGRSGGRRRNASNEAQDQQNQQSGGENENNGDAGNKGGNRRRPRRNTGNRGVNGQRGGQRGQNGGAEGAGGENNAQQQQQQENSAQ